MHYPVLKSVSFEQCTDHTTERVMLCCVAGVLSGPEVSSGQCTGHTTERVILCCVAGALSGPEVSSG